MRSLVRYLFLLALVAFVAPARAPAAVQGTGVGTLPGRTVNRAVGWLDAWATVKIEPTSGAEFDLRSTHDAEDGLWGTPPADTQAFDATWTWHGARITLHVPRLSSELGDEGYIHFCDRFARQVGEAQRRMPPDA